MITGVVVPVSLAVLAIVGPLVTARLQPPASAPAPSSLPSASDPSQGGNIASGTDVTSGEGGEDVTVSAGNTATVFGGKVFVALLKTEAEGDPPRNTASFTLSSDDAGVKDKRFSGKDAGFSYPFNDFKVRVMSVETGSARFRVTRLAAEPTSEPTSGPRH